MRASQWLWDNHPKQDVRSVGNKEVLGNERKNFLSETKHCLASARSEGIGLVGGSTAWPEWIHIPLGNYRSARCQPKRGWMDLGSTMVGGQCLTGGGRRISQVWERTIHGLVPNRSQALRMRSAADWLAALPCVRDRNRKVGTTGVGVVCQGLPEADTSLGGWFSGRAIGRIWIWNLQPYETQVPPAQRRWNRRNGTRLKKGCNTTRPAPH